MFVSECEELCEASTLFYLKAGSALHQSQIWLTWELPVEEPQKAQRKNIKCCLSPITFTLPLIDTPSESNLQSSPVKPTHRQAHRANQAVEMTRHYFKILLEKVQELGATFRASSGGGPLENQQGILTFLFRGSLQSRFCRIFCLFSWLEYSFLLVNKSNEKKKTWHLQLVVLSAKLVASDQKPLKNIKTISQKSCHHPHNIHSVVWTPTLLLYKPGSFHPHH